MSENQYAATAARMRPAFVAPISVADASGALGALGAEARIAVAPGTPQTAWQQEVTGVAVDSRAVLPGDLYAALPGAQSHGAEFTAQAVRAGAAAVLTDPEGAGLLAAEPGVPVFLAGDVRTLVGPLSAAVYRSLPPAGGTPVLFGITGTNGKTTTTYFINSLLRALGRSTGIIGTIAIVAGGDPIPSVLTTPESPQIHGLLARMREHRLDAASMEVSSHAISYRRVDGVVFDVAGFTNLTQDHLDHHGTMENYFEAKSALFQPRLARRSVINVDDEWGRRMAAAAGTPVVTVLTTAPAGGTSGGPSSQGQFAPAHQDAPYIQDVPARLDAPDADWHVADVERVGLGYRFRLVPRSGEALTVRTGLPGEFNVSNAALAAVMVLASGIEPDTVQRALDEHDPFTLEVPGRMQLVGESPAAIVDFAHNPDALQRTLASVRQQREGSRVIAVFGATGQRDQTKRPIMGAIAARLADVVIVTDDDPHDEDEAAIRAEVLAGAEQARRAEALSCVVEEVHPRAAAIDRAVELARPGDTVLVAGRGHEVWQEVKGVNVALDDRVELRRALRRHGFPVADGHAVES